MREFSVSEVSSVPRGVFLRFGHLFSVLAELTQTLLIPFNILLLS